MEEQSKKAIGVCEVIVIEKPLRIEVVSPGPVLTQVKAKSRTKARDGGVGWAWLVCIQVPCLPVFIVTLVLGWVARLLSLASCESCLSQKLWFIGCS